MRLEYEEMLFIIRAMSTAHGSDNPYDTSDNRRQAADLVDRLGAGIILHFNSPFLPKLIQQGDVQENRHPNGSRGFEITGRGIL